LEAQERQTYERKQQLKESLATGKALPTELRKDAKGLGKDYSYDEAQAGTLHRLWADLIRLTFPRTKDPYR